MNLLIGTAAGAVVVVLAGLANTSVRRLAVVGAVGLVIAFFAMSYSEIIGALSRHTTHPTLMGLVPLLVVTLSAMDRSGKRHTVATHVHEENGSKQHTPSPDSMAIVVAGSRHWQLPAGWVAGLEEYVSG